MKKDEYLDQILISIESQINNTNSINNQLIQDEIVPDIYSKPINNYLIEPYENGYWEFSQDWCIQSEFHKEVLNQTKIIPGFYDPEKNKEDIFSFITDRSLKSTNEKKKLIQITKTASFPLHTFKYIVNPQENSYSKKFEQSIDFKSIEKNLVTR